MLIEQAIKEYCKKRHPEDRGFYIPTDELGYWNVNVLFINSDGKEDETQFDISPADFTTSVVNVRNSFFCGKTSVQKIRSNKILLRVFISFVAGKNYSKAFVLCRRRS